MVKQGDNTMTEEQAREFLEEIRRLRPMQRMFVISVLRQMHDGERTDFGADPKVVHAEYEEWLSGFPADVIEAFESERPGWEVRV